MTVTYDLRTADGREAEAMRQIIELRRKELGETTAQCCKALVINILKSVRADTRVATEKGDIKIQNVDSQYYPSWKKDGKLARRVLRNGPNGNVVEEERVCWNTKRYVKGEKYHTFAVADHIGEGKVLEYLVVSKNEGTAMRFAQNFHKKKVRRGKYLAKYVLGMAMHEVHGREHPTVGQITDEARKVGLQSLKVNVTEGGFDSGDMDIHVEDRLDYATKALKSGEDYVQTAVRKALNSMAGYLNRRLEKKNIEDKIKIPFEELVEK